MTDVNKSAIWSGPDTDGLVHDAPWWIPAVLHGYQVTFALSHETNLEAVHEARGRPHSLPTARTTMHDVVDENIAVCAEVMLALRTTITT